MIEPPGLIKISTLTNPDSCRNLGREQLDRLHQPSCAISSLYIQDKDKSRCFSILAPVHLGSPRMKLSTCGRRSCPALPLAR